MKTKTLQTKLVTAILLLGFLFLGNFAKAQKTKTVYYYATAVLENKKFAVTRVITSEIKEYNHASSCKANLQSYLMDYIPAETSYKIDWGSNSSTAVMGGTGSSYDDANKFRMQDIKRYKDWGYDVVYLNYVSFSCDQ